MKHLLTLTQDELLEVVMRHVMKDNPQLKRGARLQGPVGLVRDGELLPETVDTTVLPHQVAEAHTFKIRFDENGILENTEMSARGWIYPYTAFIGDVETLKMKVGDMITVVDRKTFEMKQVSLTEEAIAARRSIIFRFATAGNWTPEPDTYV